MIGQRFSTVSSGHETDIDTHVYMGEIDDEKLVQHVRGHGLTICLYLRRNKSLMLCRKMATR